MIGIYGNRVHLQLGSGDVHFGFRGITYKDDESPRGCLVLMQGDPGNIGDIDDGRKYAIPDKFSTEDEIPNMISLESSSVESLDVLINLLLKYRKREFPNAEHLEGRGE